MAKKEVGAGVNVESDLHGLTPKGRESRLEFAQRVIAAERAAVPVVPEIEEIVEGVDPFVDLWSTLDDDDVVSLRRISPTSMVGPVGETIDIKGHLEDLPPGSTIEYVKLKYGGGTYYVQRRNGNKFLGLKKLVVSGPPRCPDVAVAALSQAAPDVVVGVDVDGVPQGGTDAQWEASISRLMATKALLSEGSGGVNADLLKLVLESRGPSITELVGQMGSLVTGVRDMLPSNGGGGGGGGLLDLGGKLLDAVSKLADRGAPVARPGVVIPSAPVRALPESGAGEETQSLKENGGPMAQQFTMKEVAGAAIGNLIAAFQLEPPKEPARVVTLLDGVLGLDKEVRIGLAKYEDLLFDMAEAQLVDLFAEIPERRAEFAIYFERIFTSFTDAEREVISL
jgi:hypothetical protein